MTQTSSERPSLDDPRLLPFLPMLYVAWADDDLDASEIAAICPTMGAGYRGLLQPWLDATNPPSASELQRMLRQIRVAAKGLDITEKLDLVGLGLKLAQADGTVVEAERQALESLAESLGIDGTEAARQLLATRRPAQRSPEAAPTFDVDALSRQLAGPDGALRQRVFELLKNDGFVHPQDILKDDYRELVLSWCQRLADEGLGGLSYPTENGGGGDLGAFIATVESLAFFDLSLVIKFGVQFGLFGGAILNLGTERHHQELLPKVASLELPGCFAMTETSHGSNVADLETTATWLPATDEIEVHTPSRGAWKNYIGNAARHGRMAVVFAQLHVGEEEHGVHAVLVPLRNEEGTPLQGITIEDCGAKMGLNGVDNGRLAFDHVRVPRANLLDRFATLENGVYESSIPSPGRRFFTMLGTLVGGRVSIGLSALSASKSALRIAVSYAVRRRQFGPGGAPEVKLLDYPSHQRRLLPRLATTYALHFALDRLRADYVKSDALERRQVELDAAGLKAYATWHATDTIQECREACGGQGYLAENRFAALKADTDVFTTFEGDNTVLLLLLAKGKLSGLKRQFGDMGILGLARWLGEQSAQKMMEMNPVTTRLTSDEHLLSREFHLAAFRWREEHLLSGVARRLKARLDQGLEPSDAMLECQDHLLTMAKAAVELQVLERFAEAVEATQGEAERAVLSQVCDLFALSRLETDRAFFLETGWIEPPKSRAIRDLVLRLCSDVRGQAWPLVKAFGIPDNLLAAPIAS
jgi:acyl-CoA oxidase